MAGGADGPHHDPQNIQNPSVRLGRARVRACSRHRVRLRLTNGAGGAALFDIVNVQNWTRRRISGPFKHVCFRTGSGAAILLSIFRAGLAHRAEHSPRKREAGGSSPPASTRQALVAKRQTQPPQKRPPSRRGGSSPPGCTNVIPAQAGIHANMFAASSRTTIIWRGCPPARA